MIFAKNFVRKYKKNNTFNISHLVGGSLGQMNKHFIVLYIRLTEFYSGPISFGFIGFSELTSGKSFIQSFEMKF